MWYPERSARNALKRVTTIVNLLRKEIKDEWVVHMVKWYLRSGVMENGVFIDTEEGSPQ